MSSRYCRYCGHLCETDIGYFCQEKANFFTAATVRSHSCSEFGDCGIDILTGKDVTLAENMRKPYTRRSDDGEQIGMEI